MLILINPLFAQLYNFKNYSVQEGLYYSEITDFYEAENGCVYIGTYGGGIKGCNQRGF